MFGDGLAAVLATTHAFFRDSIDGSRYLAAVVGIASPFGITAVVDSPLYVPLLAALGFGLATYYIAHYPVRYYDPLAGESVNWDAIAIAALLVVYLLPRQPSAATVVVVAAAVAGLWVAVVAMARLDVHAPPKWYHHVRRDEDPEPSPRVERAVAWVAARPPVRTVRSIRDVSRARLREDRRLAWWAGAAASGVGFLTAGFVLELPDAVPYALLLGLAPLAYYGTHPERPETSRHRHRHSVQSWLTLTAGLVVINGDGSLLEYVVAPVAFVLLLEGVTVAEQVRVGEAFGECGRDGSRTEGDDAAVDHLASSKEWTDGD